MASSRSKTAYGFQQALIAFLAECWRESRFLTLTFEECIQDLSEAKARFKPIRDWMACRRIEYLGVWERQERGAWHVHMMLSRPLNIAELRVFAVRRGWGRIMNIKKTGSVKIGRGRKGMRYAWPQNPTRADFVKCSLYLLKYLQKGQVEHYDMKESLIVASRSRKTWSTAFKFMDSGRIWNAGLEIYRSMAVECGNLGKWWKNGWAWRNRAVIWRLGYEWALDQDYSVRKKSVLWFVEVGPEPECPF